MQKVLFKRDLTTGLTTSLFLEWTWHAKDVTSDNRYHVMKSATSNIEVWNGTKKKTPLANFFFTSSSPKAVASTLTTPPAKRLKLSEKSPDTGSASSTGPTQDVINVDELGASPYIKCVCANFVHDLVVRLYIECVCAKCVDELGAIVQ